MPKKALELSALEVRRLKHSGQKHNATFAVGGVDGLMLQISPSGARSWILRSQIGDKRRNMGLGGYPSITLAQARERARDAKDAIWRGEDPIRARRVEKAAIAASQLRVMSFSVAMEKYLKVKLAEFGNEKHRRQWRATLDAYAIPILGAMQVDEITVQDIQGTLSPIWSTKTETASRLRGRIEAVLAWATVNGHRSGDNPARWRGNLDAVLPKPSRISKVIHHPALSLSDANQWYAEVCDRNGTAARALEFMALTAARSGEVRGATWDEIDLEAMLWTVPAARMKMRREHRFPLTKEVMTLLSNLPRFQGSPYVFAASRGGRLSDMALSACMRRIHAAREGGGFIDQRSRRPAVPHGLRSTFRDWATEKTDYPSEMAEIALAHKVGTEVERAYRRGDMLAKRRNMMADWSKFLRDEDRHADGDEAMA